MILWFFLAVFSLSCIMMGWLLWPFVSVIILAIVVAAVFTPVYKFLIRRLNPTLSSLLTCVLIFIVLFLPLSFLVGILANEAWELYLTTRGALQNKPIMELLEKSDIFDTINHFLARFKIEITGEQLNRAIAEVGRVVALFLYEQARSITTNVLKFIVNFFFMLLIIFYLLIDSPRLLSFIVKISPLPEDQDQILIQKFKDIATAILLGNGLGGLIQGTLGGIVFAVFGLKSPFVWGVIMALLAFLPILGIGVVFVPAAILLFLQGRISAGIFFLTFYIILSGGIEYFFKPKLVGQRVRMHTLIVFLSIIGGLKLFGILGIIYGPLVVTAFLTLSEIYLASYQQMVEPTK
ncbi:MAG: AI-2E family transporter [Desulfobacterales bacterium]|jgi:predicted PurR-regulated permease PerM